MKVEDITNEEDVSRYIEGCLNDLEFGLCTKYDTERYLHSLIIYLIKLERGKRDKELADILRLGKQRSDQQEDEIERLTRALKELEEKFTD